MWVTLIGCSASEGSSSDTENPVGMNGVAADEPVPQLPSAKLLGFDPALQRLLRQARDLLIEQCMADRGFDYVPYPELDTDLISLFDLYGSISIQQAGRFGYHNPNAMRLAEIETEQASYNTKVAAQRADDYYAALNSGTDPCTSSANLDLYGTEYSPSESGAALQVLQVAGETVKRVNADPQFIAAADDWHRCMNDLGYDVEVLSDTRMSYQFEPTDTRSPGEDERRMAVADAGCHRETRLDEIIIDLYSQAFTELLEENQGVAEELESAFSRAESRALELVGATATTGS